MQLPFEAPQLVQRFLVAVAVKGLAARGYECAGQQFEPVWPDREWHRAIRICIYEEIADESGSHERLLNVVSAADMQRLKITVRRRGVPIDRRALAIHRRDVRLEQRPACKTKLARDDELRIRELRGGLQCVERVVCNGVGA